VRKETVGGWGLQDERGYSAAPNILAKLLRANKGLQRRRRGCDLSKGQKEKNGEGKRQGRK